MGLKLYAFNLKSLFLPFLFFPIIGLPFLIYSITLMNNELKLYKYGKVKSGKILSMISKPGLRYSEVGKGVTVRYKYETTNGNSITGESLVTDLALMSNKKKGDFISIFVSTENFEKSCVIPKIESLRNNWNIK